MWKQKVPPKLRRCEPARSISWKDRGACYVGPSLSNWSRDCSRLQYKSAFGKQQYLGNYLAIGITAASVFLFGAEQPSSKHHGRRRACTRRRSTPAEKIGLGGSKCVLSGGAAWIAASISTKPRCILTRASAGGLANLCSYVRIATTG
jgi:hypothetical protein